MSPGAELITKPRHQPEWGNISQLGICSRREVPQELPQLVVADLNIQVEPVSIRMFAFAKMIVEVRPFIGDKGAYAAQGLQ